MITVECPECPIRNFCGVYRTNAPNYTNPEAKTAYYDCPLYKLATEETETK